MTPTHFIRNDGSLSNSNTNLKINGNNNIIQLINRNEKKDKLIDQKDENEKEEPLQSRMMLPQQAPINMSTIYEKPYQIPFSQVSPQVANRVMHNTIRPLNIQYPASNISDNRSEISSLTDDNSYMRDGIDLPSSHTEFRNSYGSLKDSYYPTISSVPFNDEQRSIFNTSDDVSSYSYGAIPPNNSVASSVSYGAKQPNNSIASSYSYGAKPRNNSIASSYLSGARPSSNSSVSSLGFDNYSLDFNTPSTISNVGDNSSGYFGELPDIFGLDQILENSQDIDDEEKVYENSKQGQKQGKKTFSISNPLVVARNRNYPRINDKWYNQFDYDTIQRFKEWKGIPLQNRPSAEEFGLPPYNETPQKSKRK